MSPPERPATDKGGSVARRREGRPASAPAPSGAATAARPPTAIVSAANPRFRQWRRLLETPRAIREQAATLVEGEHLARAALAAGADLRAVLVRGAPDDLRPPEAACAAAAAGQGAPTYLLAPALYDALAPVEHGSGLMLELGLPAEVAPGSPATADVLVLDGVQEPGNAGALLRVAAAAGVGHVWTTPGTTALWAPKAMRAAMGAHFALQIVERLPLGALMVALAGTTIHAADATGGQDLWTVAFPAGPVAWVMGGEGAGLSSDIRVALAAAGASRVRIPLAAGVESLNVAAAAAVCLFERRRQAARLLR